MPASKPVTQNDIRSIAAKVDRWATEAEEDGDDELAAALYNAHTSLYDARQLLRGKNKQTA